MLFIETDIFTEDVKALLDDDEYHKLQVFLATQPDYGWCDPAYRRFMKNSLACQRERKTRGRTRYLFSPYAWVWN